jgi:hypothetical protein
LQASIGLLDDYLNLSAPALIKLNTAVRLAGALILLDD